jgi:uncharacterized protein YggU (UPF0235/DUF167 family)
LKITARVKPGSKRSGITIEDGSLVLRVRERALEGEANEACVHALAQALGVAPSYVRLLRGARSREKLFEIDGIDESEARKRLGLGV